MASTLTVRVVSPEREVFRGAATAVVAPAWDGLVGILPGHAPFIVLLGAGKLRIDLPGGGSSRHFVAGGVMKVEGNGITVLTEYSGEGPPEKLPPEADFDPDELEAEAKAAAKGKKRQR
jgi:F-type H+-transporting ATPase subunit epsilon